MCPDCKGPECKLGIQSTVEGQQRAQTTHLQRAPAVLFFNGLLLDYLQATKSERKAVMPTVFAQRNCMV